MPARRGLGSLAATSPWRSPFSRRFQYSRIVMSDGPARGEMSPEEVERGQAVVTFLNQFVPSAWTFFRECHKSPGPDSFIARAKKDPDLVQVLDAALWLDAAGDFLLAVLQLFTHKDGVLRFSPYTSARGALEADAWACWLLDPDANDKERIGRALSLRARGLFEMKRLRFVSDKHYAERINRVIEAGQRWGLELRNRDSWRLSFVQTPGPTALIRCLLPEQSTRNRELTDGEQTYGELSARSHGTTWALLSGISPIEKVDEFQTTGLSEIDVLEFIRLLGIVVSLHDKAVRRVAIASGVDPSVWETRRGELPW
jgi:hypothetical protein